MITQTRKSTCTAVWGFILVAWWPWLRGNMGYCMFQVYISSFVASNRLHIINPPSITLKHNHTTPTSPSSRISQRKSKPLDFPPVRGSMIEMERNDKDKIEELQKENKVIVLESLPSISDCLDDGNGLSIVSASSQTVCTPNATPDSMEEQDMTTSLPNSNVFQERYKDEQLIDITIANPSSTTPLEVFSVVNNENTENFSKKLFNPFDVG